MPEWRTDQVERADLNLQLLAAQLIATPHQVGPGYHPDCLIPGRVGRKFVGSQEWGYLFMSSVPPPFSTQYSSPAMLEHTSATAEGRLWLALSPKWFNPLLRGCLNC